MEKDYKDLEDIVRTRYGSVAWTHKIHEKQAEIYDKEYGILAVINIIAASVTSAGIVSLIFTDNTLLKIVSALVSFVTICINSLLKVFNLQDMVKTSKTAATKLVALRDDLQTLLLKIHQGKKPIDELTAEFDELQERIHIVYQEVPTTTNKALKKAEIALKVTKDNNFSDNEIDMMLPEALRRTADD